MAEQSVHDSKSIYAEAIHFVGHQADRIIQRYPDYYPMYTVGGKWNLEGERWTHWCEGFFPGILWLLHQHTGENRWRREAERYSRPLEPRKMDRDVHDLGFIFFSTYLRWYHFTNDEYVKGVLLQAGETLAKRFQPKGKYLASFIGPHSLFIDIMMNVGIIFWAARETGDEALNQIALDHCRTTQKYLVREDGGTAHEGTFDVETGRFLHQSTHQGYSPESTWSRGLAWAIYGFTAAHRLSGEAAFLQTAIKCAGFYLRNMPEGGVPYWDFDAPANPTIQWDSSAGAIAACGLFDLVNEVHDELEKKKYATAAQGIMHTLCSPQFMAHERSDWEGILMHGVYHTKKYLGVDESVAWGEHFFVEGLVKALEMDEAAG